VTTVSYALGTPPAATGRGGDCRARDLTLARNVYGGHRFAATTDCRISNGLLRLTLGAIGAAPALTMEARRGSSVIVGDVYDDTYRDTYGGSYATPSWLAMGTLSIDTTSATSLLTGVRLVAIDAEAVTILLTADVGVGTDSAYVTLRRGERMCRIQHGSTRAPLVTLARRIRLTASPSPVGTASVGRVEEVAPYLDGMPRFVAAGNPATTDASAFSLTTTGTREASFAAGVGTYALRDGPADMHVQLADTSTPSLVMA
jgi:hypothetical protein